MSFEFEIESHIDNFMYMYEYLVKCKNNGMSKEIMMEKLERIRSRCDSENEEDMILDLMDFVGGWCSPHMRIFEEE